MKKIIFLLVVSCFILLNCSNFHVKHVVQPVDNYQKGSLPIASQQSLISSAADEAFSQIRFNQIRGKIGYIEVTGVYEDEIITNYLAAKCEERLAASGVAILPQKLKIFENKISVENSKIENLYNVADVVPNTSVFPQNERQLLKNRHKGIFSPVFNYYIEPVDADYKFQVIAEVTGVDIENERKRDGFWYQEITTYTGIVNVTIAAIPLKAGLPGEVQKGSASGTRIISRRKRSVFPILGPIINLFVYTGNTSPYIPAK